MSFLELFLIAVGLSMDAFAAAICAGLTMTRVTVKKSLTVGLYFGSFQAGMPLIGYFVSTRFADSIEAYDHWVAFALLSFLGGKMIFESFKKEACSDRICPSVERSDKDTMEISLTPASMLPLALATSIDAMAAGVSFAFLQVSIVPAVSFIGITTLVISMIGTGIGNVFGTRFKSKAEFAGGVILALIGLKILLEHLGFIAS